MVMFTGNGRHIVVIFAFDRPFEKIADFQRYIDRLPPTSSLSINPISKEFFVMLRIIYQMVRQMPPIILILDQCSYECQER